MKSRLILLFGAASLLVTPVRAQDPPVAPTSTPPVASSIPLAEPSARFGDPGRIAVDTDFDIRFGRLAHSGEFDVPWTYLAVRPSADVFVARNISVGGALFFRHEATQTVVLGPRRPQYIDVKATSYGACVRLGVNIPFGDWASLWPRAAVGMWKSKVDAGKISLDLDPNSLAFDLGHTETAVWIGLYAPVLIHPARHFFLGIGPDVFVDLSHRISEATHKRTFWGASSVVGGWF